MPRWLLVFVLFVVGLVLPTIASAATTAYAETGVGAFDLAVHVGVGLSVDQAAEKHRGIGFTCDEIASGSPHAAGEIGAGGGGGATRLFRAVSPAELADIKATGAFRPSPTGLEGKYFSTTAEGASQYGRMAVRGFGDAPYTIVETTMPNGTAPLAPFVDRGIPTVVVPNTALPTLGQPIIWPFMPIP